MGALAALGGLLVAMPAAAQTCSPGGIGLDQAVTLARTADLRPDAIRAAIDAARAERAIAGFRPQDRFELSTENYPGFGLGSDIENLDITGRYTRVWERGGKREAREALADAGVGVAQADMAVVEADIAYEIETLFVSLWSTRTRLELAQERLAVARDVQALVTRRVAAARDPELAARRAATEVSLAESDIVTLEMQRDTLSAAIAAFWNEDSGNFDTCSFHPRAPETGASAGAVQPPELARYEAQQTENRARMRLSQAEAVPDVTWGMGVRSFGLDDDVALVGSVSIPLGTPPRSSARVARDRAQQARITAEADALVQGAERQRRFLRQRAETARQAWRRLETSAIADARDALDLATDGYERGAFTYLDVIEARRTLFDLHARRIDLLETYFQAQASLARLGIESRSRPLPESQR
ncbi:MAG: TolC family protein [Nitratireductor sp.]